MSKVNILCFCKGEFLMAKRKGTKLTRYFQLSGKNIVIPFDAFFDPKLEDYNEFVMSIASKKTYSKIANLFVEENNIILNRCPELIIEQFLYNYLTLKIGIDTDRYINRVDPAAAFRNEMINNLFNSEFMKCIQDYIDEKYETDVDDQIDLEKHKYDKGTTFLDRHFKVLYTVSSMSRFVLPLATHYIHFNPTVDTNIFLMDLFMDLMNIAQLGTNTDVYAKLHTYVVRAVQKTRVTDKVMWDRLMILGVTPENAIDDTLNKLITNVIPKYIFEKNIMNLNTVVIRKSIMSYTLRKRDPYTIYSLSDSDGVATDDDAIVSEIDIFDSYNTQRDESIILFRKHAIQRNIDIIQMREQVEITPEEIEFYSKSKRYHEFQKSAICFMFSRYFGGVENIIGGCRKEDWVRLMIILVKVMERMGIGYLSHFVTSIKQNHAFKRLSKFLDNAINNDPLYQEIIEKKYRSVMGMFERRNFIKQFIIMIINNTYIYNTHNHPLNGQFIEKDEIKIKDEVLQFFNSCIL